MTTTIDKIEVVGSSDLNKEFVLIEKLKDFLIWREKEFVEKYEGLRYNTDADSYGSFESTVENGNPLVAIMNTTVLQWDRKTSHPWILIVEIKYGGEKNNGMPDKETMELLNQIEDEITGELKDFEGNINIGRQTADGYRDIYFACKDFRKPSKVVYSINNKYKGEFEITYNIYKDKYWSLLNRFSESIN